MMIRRPAIAVAALTWLMASASIQPAQAQSWEVSGLLGYTSPVDLDNQAPQFDDVTLRGGLTWGVQGGWLFTPHWGVEVLWTRHDSALEIDTGAGAADLFEFNADLLQGNVLYHFNDPRARLRAFVFAGAGATIFSADDLESETKLSLGLGGGVKYFPWRAIGIRGHIRYHPTVLDDEDAEPFCDPFGFCQNWLRQVEVAAGVVVRF